ncbi:MAG: endopeptidase La, partial [Candidatus Latescibacteria bacterium]|nr:endopeptidase La [Candidatus Latescibacterota bacterium]
PAVPAQLSSTRQETIQLVTQALETQSPIALITLRRATNTPTAEDFHHTGTAATIQRMWHLPDGSIRFLVQSQCRVAITNITETSDTIHICPKIIPSRVKKSQHQQALVSGVSAQFQQILSLTPHLPDELQIAILNINTPDHLSDFIAFHLNIGLSEKQDLLDEYDPTVRLQRLAQVMSQELEMLELGVRVRSQVQSELDHSRKEHLIREQIKALQHELGESDTRTIEIASLKSRLENNNLPPEAYAAAIKEIDRLSRMPFTAPEYTASHTYLDWLLDLPWAKQTSKPIDLDHAQNMLDRYHTGLDHIKERILEDLSVRKLTNKNHSTILCLVGPPGVGKTSLGQSIAQALDRPFVRVALGGLRDEAELRGHRRTYVGALPGRIIQGLRSAGAKDPVIMLDEIDKLGVQGAGDPAGVLLEILDPAQNQSFVDHYLNLPIDLSQVLFITTANVMQNIPDALRDRLEVLTLSGYLDNEKTAIVRSHILPQQRAAHGLSPQHLKLPAKTVRYIIAHYTQEPGLRQLERQIGVLCRRIARRVAKGSDVSVTIQTDDLTNYLGLPYQTATKPNTPPTPGVVTGLAATPVGGQHFTVETTTMPGTGAILLTGHLGEIIKESAQTAVSYIRANSHMLGIDKDRLQNVDIHIHVPAGAIPKDGPSAGLAMCLSLISHLKNHIISPEIAITGEITLTGQVLGVGAIRDKLLAAQRAQVCRVILPEANRSEVDLLPNTLKQRLQLNYVSDMHKAHSLIFKETSNRGH